MNDRILLELSEGGRRPEVDTCEVVAGEEVRIVWSPAAAPLRRLLLRAALRRYQTEAERTILWLRAPTRVNEPFQVMQVDRDVVGSPRMVAPDDLVVPIEQGMALPTRAELILMPEGERELRVELRVVDLRLPRQGTVADVSGGLSEGGGRGGPSELDWEVPGAFDSIARPVMNRIDGLTEKVVQKMRAPPALLRVLVYIGVVVGLVGFAFVKGRAADRAETRLAEVQVESERAEEASVESAEDAGRCRQELADLHRQLLNPTQARRSLIASTLDWTLARSAMIAGAEEGPELTAALARDELERPSLVTAVETTLAAAELTAEDREWIARRLESAPALDGTLPAWSVLWSPRPDQRLEAPSTLWSSGGSSLRGMLWLGERPLRLVGGYAGPLDLDVENGSGTARDPRLQAEWSLATLASGLHSVEDVLVGRRVRGRVVVPPEQVHLWSYALFHAWNELPESVEESGSIATCVGLLLEGMAENQAADPGEAVLPLISEVVEKDRWTERLRRSADCPWRPEDLVTGSRLALNALAEATAVKETL